VLLFGPRIKYGIVDPVGSRLVSVIAKPESWTDAVAVARAGKAVHVTNRLIKYALVELDIEWIIGSSLLSPIDLQERVGLQAANIKYVAPDFRDTCGCDPLEDAKTGAILQILRTNLRQALGAISSRYKLGIGDGQSKP